IDELPDELFQCRKLQYLLLGHNSLTNLSPRVGGLLNLVQLELIGNHLESLPAELEESKSSSVPPKMMASDALITLPPSSTPVASTSTLDTGLSTLKHPIPMTWLASSTPAKKKKKDKSEKGHKASGKGSKKSLKEGVQAVAANPSACAIDLLLKASPSVLSRVALTPPVQLLYSPIQQVNPPMSYPVLIDQSPSRSASEPDDVVLLYTPR
ncbi:UNVERIFIED_CONTAM: hypothetical protein K2H54_042606, partial [Gekko kuhli]